MSGTKIRKFPELRVFLEVYSDEAMVSSFDEYHKAVVRWRVWTKGHLEELLEKNKICNDCPVSDFCAYEDCPAFDKLKEIYVSLGGDEKHE